jgi:hypothetical protein
MPVDGRYVYGFLFDPCTKVAVTQHDDPLAAGFALRVILVVLSQVGCDPFHTADAGVVGDECETARSTLDELSWPADIASHVGNSHRPPPR